MKLRVLQILEQAADLHNELRSDPEVSLFLEEVAELCIKSVRNGGKILLAGNGGSAADCQHIAAELVGRFKRERNPIPAMALNTDTSILTAISNDYGFDKIFSRQIRAHGREGDVVILITTSGESLNILTAQHMAINRGLDVVLFDNSRIPSKNTARIQECHILFGHILCELIEENLWEERA